MNDAQQDYISFLSSIHDTLSGGEPNVYALYFMCFAVMVLSVGLILLLQRVYFSAAMINTVDRKYTWKTNIMVGYLLAGLLIVALPLTWLVPATTPYGTVFLTIIWPIWLSQSIFDFTLVPYIPEWIKFMLFSF